MKKYFAATLLLLFAFSVFSQDNLKNKDYYLQKSKNQKTAGWILFSGGAAIMTISAITILTNNGSYGVLMGVPLGVVIIITSVPFFNASVRNKKKGMSLSFKKETAPQIQKGRFVYRSVPSIALKISL